MSNKVSVIAIICLSVVSLGLLWNTFRNPSENAPVSDTAKSRDHWNTVTLSIDDHESFIANEFKITFNVVQKHKEKNRAVSLLNESREKVLSLFKDLHVAKTEYELQSMSLKKEYDYSGKQKNMVGYIASQSVEIYLSSKTKSDEVERKLATMDFVDELETIGGLRNVDSLEVETIRRICKKVRARSDVYARSVGAAAGTVLAVEGNSSIDEGNHYTDSVGIFARLKVSVQLQDGSEAKQAYVQVRQSESKKFLADMFMISAGAVMDGDNKERIYSQVGQIKDSIVALARNLGVAESEINVHTVKVHHKKSWEFDSGEPSKNRFRASQFVTVSFTSKQDAAAFLRTVAEANHVAVRSIQSVLKNRDSLEVVVTNLAGKKAMVRAKAIAEGLDGKLGQVVYVGNSDDGYSVVDEISYDARSVGKTVLGKNRAISGFAGGLAGLLGGGGGAENMLADSVAVGSQVNVIAELLK